MREKEKLLQYGRRLLFQKAFAWMLILTMLFSLLPSNAVWANEEWLNAQYNPETDCIDFYANFPHAKEVQIRCADTNNWKRREEFVMNYQNNPNPNPGGQGMKLSVPYSYFTTDSFKPVNNSGGYKAVVVYEGDPAEHWKPDGDNKTLPTHKSVRSIKTTYTPSENGREDTVTFTVRANKATHGYVMSAGNGFQKENPGEKYRFGRSAEDTGKNQLMTITLDYKDLLGSDNKNEGYKVILNYEGESDFEWMKEDGTNNGEGNSPLPERTGAPVVPPVPSAVPFQVKTTFVPDGPKIRFEIVGDGVEEAYIMCQKNGWGNSSSGMVNLDSFDKATYQAVKPQGAAENKYVVEIPYSALYHWEKTYEYKVYTKKDGQYQWLNADGQNAENSFFPMADGTPYDGLIATAFMDNPNEIKAYIKQGFENVNTEYVLAIDDEEQNITPTKSGDALTFDTSGLASSGSLIQKQCKVYRKGGQTKKNVQKRKVLDTLVYPGDDLGVSFSDSQITLKLWAPTANAVDLMIYDSYGNDSFETDKLGGTAHSMTYDASTGIYSVSVSRAENENKFYLYRLRFNDEIKYAIDPYAVAVGINGKMGALVDLNSADTMPNGFAEHTRPELKNLEDSILYEMHIRDFTINENWNGEEQKRGKYLGVVEPGTFYSVGDKTVKTGLEHLKELGITHVHILPPNDFATIDESQPAPYDSTSANEKANQRNWGYDPKNFNAPDGSYSADPFDPRVRIREYREMVMKLHQEGIRVVNDVVYNHVYDMTNFNNIVEGYYFRSDDKGYYTNDSGVGNGIASERPMVRKFIVDSAKHWVNTYRLDGLRFDLMAIIDTETMRQLKLSMPQGQNILLYGEPWAGYNQPPIPEDTQTKKNKGIGFFNDTYRNAIRGDNNPGKGYVTNVYDKVGDIINGLKAHDAATDPEYVVNYVEAHDNYAIWDQIEKSENPSLADGNYRQGIPDNALTNWKVNKAILAQSFVLLAQGIPFFQGGSEILRTKQGDHNSYRSNDEINDIDWDEKIQFQEVFDYYKGLIAIRKNQSLFRLTTKEAIAKHVEIGTLNYDNSLVYQYLHDNPVAGEWKNILVLYNANNDAKTISWLPGDHQSWTVIADKAGVYLEREESKRTVHQKNGANFNFTLPSNSVMILYNQDAPAVKTNDIQWDYLYSDRSTDYMEPMEPKVTDEVKVRFRAKAGEVTAAKLHYYVGSTETIVDMNPITESVFYTSRGLDPNEIVFYEGTIPAGREVKYYHFEIINHTDPSKEAKRAWISAGKGDNGKGISNAKGPKGFMIVPGYRSPAWAKESVFYQLMVDRFRDGDESNNKTLYDFANNGDRPEIAQWGDAVTNGRETDKIWNNQFFGGDLVGVREALPYLYNILGVDALYFMPLFQSDSDHKYDGETYEYIDSAFGGNRVLAELGTEMNGKNYRYILDGAFNHSAAGGKLFRDHRDFFFTGSYTDDNGKTYDYVPWHYKYFNFAKLDYSKQAVKEYIFAGENAVAKKYLKAPFYSAGWRLDAAEDVSAVPRDYKVKGNSTTVDQEVKTGNLAIWKEFRAALPEDVYLLGEYWGNENHWYVEKAWNGKMNYGGFYLPFIENRKENRFLGDQSLDNKGEMSVAGMVQFTKDYIADFPYSTVLGSTNSISTHDRPRFLNMEYGNSNVMMKLAQTLQMTMPGAPMIYYGDEIGIRGKGGEDPYNRGTFDWNRENWNYELLNHYRRAIQTRKNQKNAFVYGALEEVKSDAANKYLVYARYGQGDLAFVVLNNHGSLENTLNLENMGRYGLKQGDELKEVFTGNSAVVGENGQLKLISPAMSSQIWVKTEKYRTNLLIEQDTDLGLTDKSDSRNKLDIPTDLHVSKQSNGDYLVEYVLNGTSVAQSGLLRVLSADKTQELQKHVLDVGSTSIILKDISKDVILAFKNVANREETVEVGGSMVKDAYRDSDYAILKVSYTGNSTDSTSENSVPTVPYQPNTSTETASSKEQIKENATIKEENTVTEEDSISLLFNEKSLEKLQQILPNTKVKIRVQKVEEFRDVVRPEEKKSIAAMANLGLMKGVGNGDFSPNKPLTRGMIVTVLARLVGVEEEDYPKATFQDIKGNEYYSSYVSWAKEKGIVQGTGDGKYHPNDSLTREQMAVILQRFLKAYALQISGENVKKYQDSDRISNYAKEAVLTLTKTGILKGKGEVFQPQDRITRAETAIVLSRLMMRLLQQSR